jgi:glycosyltransferase involved in cell wall biosynthesis
MCKCIDNYILDNGVIFFIGIYPNYGGTEKITTVLANHFSDLGLNVHIVSFQQPHLELLSELNENIVLHKLSYPVLSKNNVSVLKNIIVSNNIHIIFNQWCLPFQTTLLLNMARKGLSCKLLSILHGVPNKSKKVIVAEDNVKQASNCLTRAFAQLKLQVIDRTIRESIRYVYKHSDHYVVLSKGFIETFREYTGLKKTPKLVSIGNPITIPTNYSVDELTSKKKQILYVGRMDMENKRVNRIIEAWEEVYKKFPDWNLCLVGDGPHRSALEAYVNGRNIQRVYFTGFIKDEPVSYYRESSILMLTSDLEGFGLVIVEGMSHGVVPIVYGSYVSVFEVIDHGVNGLITNTPYSKRVTVECMVSLMEDSAKREKMAAEAIKKSANYHLESIVRQWYKLF